MKKEEKEIVRMNKKKVNVCFTSTKETDFSSVLQQVIKTHLV